jgi:hypothetical protein
MIERVMLSLKRFVGKISCWLGHRGYIMILVALMVPVFLLAVNYVIKQVQTSYRVTTKTGAACAVGYAVLESYNPAKAVSDQKSKVYTAGAQALCDHGYNLDKKMIMDPSSVILKYTERTYSTSDMAQLYSMLSTYGLKNLYSVSVNGSDKFPFNDTAHKTLICDETPVDTLSYSGSKATFRVYSTAAKNDSRSVVLYGEDTNKLDISINTTNKYIQCNCKHLGKIVNAYPAQCRSGQRASNRVDSACSFVVIPFVMGVLVM